MKAEDLELFLSDKDEFENHLASIYMNNCDEGDLYAIRLMIADMEVVLAARSCPVCARVRAALEGE